MLSGTRTLRAPFKLAPRAQNREPSKPLPHLAVAPRTSMTSPFNKLGLGSRHCRCGDDDFGTSRYACVYGRAVLKKALIGSRCMLRVVCALQNAADAGVSRCVRRSNGDKRLCQGRHEFLSCRQAKDFGWRSRWTLAPISAYSGVMRARSRSMLARPYMARLRVFSLLICPSVCPLLHGSDTALRTASMSWRSVRANRCIP